MTTSLGKISCYAPSEVVKKENLSLLILCYKLLDKSLYRQYNACAFIEAGWLSFVNKKQSSCLVRQENSFLQFLVQTNSCSKVHNSCHTQHTNYITVPKIIYDIHQMKSYTRTSSKKYLLVNTSCLKCRFTI